MIHWAWLSWTPSDCCMGTRATLTTVLFRTAMNRPIAVMSAT